MICRKCGTEITFNEAGLYKKLVNRGATDCLCINCLSEEFRIPVETLYKMIEEYKKAGCTLFA